MKSITEKSRSVYQAETSNFTGRGNERHPPANYRQARSSLQTALIDDIDPADNVRAGVVMAGPLQGNPIPDIARISVTVSENDPDQLLGGAGLSRRAGRTNIG